jgi:glycosyltransferase involved in cell wall biosynthesis
VAYVGGIAKIRGILELVQAMKQVRSNARLQLAGEFSDPEDEKQARSLPGWAAVDALGHRDRQGVRDILRRVVGGLVTFLPVPNHIEAQPNKMFEYMSAGVPVIASGFPLWREIVERHECGICVDPQNPGEVARAIDYLVTHPAEAERMGRNGQQAVHERYNWSVEEANLLSFYRRITG